MFRFMGGSKKKITKALDKPLKELNLKIDSIKYNKGELNIILDSDEIINLDKIVEATNVINKILDEKEDEINVIIPEKNRKKRKK